LKTALFYGAVLTLAIVAPLVDYSDNLGPSQVFDSGLGFAALIVCCACLGFLVLTNVPRLYRAAVRLPEVEISPAELRVAGSRAGAISKSEIVGVRRARNGWISIRLRNGRATEIPLFLFESPTLVERELKALVPFDSV